MATAAKKAPCSICGKDKGGVRCEGCSNIFCLPHFDGHRQELGKQFEEIEVIRDLFRQTLTEKTAEPQNHVLMEQIAEWEKESTNKIRQAAEKARRILLKHTTELNTKIENKLNKLTNQLRQSREENDFFETDLNQWKQELTQMENELDNPSNVTIQRDRTPLVTNINVDISDRPPQYTDFDDGALIPCEWCNQKVSLHIYQKHLEACQEKEHERLQEKARRNSQKTESATIVNSRTPPVTTVNIRTPSASSVDNWIPPVTTANIRTPSASSVNNLVPPVTTVNFRTPSASSVDNWIHPVTTVNNRTPSASSVDNWIHPVTTVNNRTPSASSVDNWIHPVTTVNNGTPSASSVDNWIPPVTTVNFRTPSASSVNNLVPPVTTVNNRTPSASSVDNWIHPVTTVNNRTPSASSVDNWIHPVTTVNNRTPSASSVDNWIHPVTTVNNGTPSASSVDNWIPSGTDTARCKFCGRSMSSHGLSYHQLICVKNPERNKNYQ